MKASSSCKIQVLSPMDDLEINQLFLKVKKSYGNVPEDVEKVFSLLVSTTLRYRDDLKSALGVILTVEDVRVTLVWLLEFMESKQFPPTNNAVRRDLLKIWTEMLKQKK